MKTDKLRSFVMLILTLGWGSTHAGELATAPLVADGAGGLMTCSAMNVSQRSVRQIRVDLVRSDLTLLGSQTCDGVIPLQGCNVPGVVVGAFVIGWCHISVDGPKKAIRASLEVLSTAGVPQVSSDAR